MNITRFEATGVNGYLNFDISFNDSITFLIGINGSGKTTAIKLILGLLSPSWINLTQIKYSYAQVECKLQDEYFTIRAEKTDTDKVRLSLSYSDPAKKTIASLVKVQDISMINPNEVTRFGLRSLANRYSRFEAHFIDLEVVKSIRLLNSPVFLGLDRRIHEGSEIDVISMDSFMKERDFTDEIKGNLYESLIEVENLIKNSFLEYSEKQSKIGSTLKNNIIYSSFDIVKTNDSNESFLNLKNNNLESRKQRIIEASSNFEIPDLEDKILNYFDELTRLEAILKKHSSKSNKMPRSEEMKVIQQWFVNSPQLQRIDKIISLYEEAQNEIVNEFQAFFKFEILANRYFQDNNKRLKIKKNGEIEIELPNRDITSIFKLSSGEKQIIVMLAQLIFGKKRQVFIIDEPELSLHLGWQEIFIDTIQEASPETQFILATHSPSIIGKIENEEYCVDLTTDIPYA